MATQKGLYAIFSRVIVINGKNKPIILRNVTMDNWTVVIFW